MKIREEIEYLEEQKRYKKEMMAYISDSRIKKDLRKELGEIETKLVRLKTRINLGGE